MSNFTFSCKPIQDTIHTSYFTYWSDGDGSLITSTSVITKLNWLGSLKI